MVSEQTVTYSVGWTRHIPEGWSKRMCSPDLRSIKCRKNSSVAVYDPDYIVRWLIPCVIHDTTHTVKQMHSV